MTIANVYINDLADAQDITIAGDAIAELRSYHSTGTDELLEFDGAIAFPGLINSHDHLDFNVFPQLARKTYTSYLEWGADIHLHNAAEIEMVKRVPKEWCVQWSLYKNLLCGVTTVVQHGTYFEVGNNLVDVFQDLISIHSVQLEKGWKRLLNKPRFKKKQVVIHIGEGKDESSQQEIDELIKWNLLKHELIGVHAIGMNSEQAKRFKAIVWCPASNDFLYKASADIERLSKSVPILFGTDSTLSAPWDMWQQLRTAKSLTNIGEEEFYTMLTTRAADVWRMNRKGSLRNGMQADIVVARKRSSHFQDAFLKVTPEDILLVVHRGRIVLFDEQYLNKVQLLRLSLSDYSSIMVRSNRKFVLGDLAALFKSIQVVYPAFAPEGLLIE